MKAITRILTGTLLCILSGFAMAIPGKSQDRPNIIFILADDLGLMDVGYNGSRLYRTPNIDALSKQGMVFTHAYSANPLCSPTRASILTGLHPARIGITFPDCHFPEEILEKGLDPKPDPLQKWIGARSVTRLKTEYITLPELLKTAGYATGHFGKWHLGKSPYDPKHHGFDEDFPQWSWAPSPSKYHAPWRWGVNGGPDKGKDGENIEDRTADEAIRFIHTHKDKPFFLNYWAWSVHGPHETGKELLEKYTAEIKPGMEQGNPYYAGMIETLDKNVGKLLDAVQESGIEKNTVIIFLSDNGGIHWPSRQVLPGVPVTSNSPLKGGKATIYEGGTRVPCIVYWPGVTRQGSSSGQLISSIDWYPTLLEMAGIPRDSRRKPDGISLVKALHGQALERNTLYCHFPQGDGMFTFGHQPSTYVREGDWKLIRFYCDNADQSDRFELYNLEADIGETKNLAARFPERVGRMSRLIDNFLAETNAVIPIPNPAYFRRNRTEAPLSLPSIATWRMDTSYTNLTAKHTTFDRLVNLRSAGRQHDIMEDSTRIRIKNAAVHAAGKNISLIADLDPRMALPTFEKRYPGDLQQMIVLKEIKTAALKDSDLVTVKSRALRDHYHKPYQTRKGGFVRAIGYSLATDGQIDPRSVTDISKDCRVVTADQEQVQVRFSPKAGHRFSEVMFFISFTYLYPDVFSPHLEEFQSDIFRKYAAIPLGGAHNDEWGFPAALSEESLQNQYWYSLHMAAAWERYAGTKRNLLDDILLMHKGIKGREQDRLKTFNLFGEFVRKRNGEIETHFYNQVKETYGPDGFVGVHATWFPYPERREFRKNGLDWWIAKRDWAQTDEVVPFAVRTSLSKKWESPVWYNMFYRYGIPEGEANADDYEREIWSAALGGGRVNNLPSVLQAEGILGSDYIKAETRIRLLNYIQRAPLNCPVAVVFGHAAAMNPVSPGFEKTGMELADRLWQAGIPADLIPTSEIENDSLKIDGEGYVRYGKQRYSAVILYNPEFEKETTALFFNKASGGKTRLYRTGNWTMDFSGAPYNGNAALPPAMIPSDNEEATVSSIRQLLIENKVPLHSPATRRLEGFGHVSYAPPAAGHSYLLDGTLIQAAGSKYPGGDTLQSTMEAGSYKVSFDAIGIAAIRLDKQGNVEALAAGGLKSLRTEKMSLTLSDRTDLALWKNQSGEWEGVIQGGNEAVPGELLSITRNWTRIPMPAGFPSTPKTFPKRVSIAKPPGPTPATPAGKVTDIDGNSYPVVRFGSQVWMAENLATTRYNDGNPVAPPAIRPDNATGRLYTWPAVQSGKLCPAGWRVPTDADWASLVDYLDHTGKTAGPAFNPRADGYLHSYGAPVNQGISGIWWSADGIDKRAVWRENSNELYIAEDKGLANNYGFSVRCIHAQYGASYDESKIPAYVLPELLTTGSGERITDAKSWEEKRRAELLELFSTHVFGHTPKDKIPVRYELVDEKKDALGGKATRKQVRLVFSNGKKEIEALLLLYIPNHVEGKVPVFVGYNFKGNHSTIADSSVLYSPSLHLVKEQGHPDWIRGNQSHRWNYHEIIDRGYAVATMCYHDIYPDHKKLRDHSIVSLFPGYRPGALADDEWQALGAWAWGSGRIADYLETEEDRIDPDRMALMGHSRQGMAALWTGAQEPRFKVVIANNAGEGAAAITRRRYGETIAIQNNLFPHWNALNYRKYNDREDDLPVDFHQLIALTAPRAVYIASAEEDRWADPQGEFLGAYHAGPAFRLYGFGAIDTDVRPPLHSPIMRQVGYHIRAGKHDVTAYDWSRFLDFADLHFKKSD